MSQASPGSPAGEEGMRLDKWLWAARFFKSRSLASEAVQGGKVHLNGQRVKPARMVRPGDTLRIRRGETEWTLEVLALATRRGPAPEARALYRETAASLEARERQREARRLRAATAPHPGHRPDKRARRHIVRFTRRGGS